MFTSYNFDQPVTDAENFYYFSQGFTKEELKQIERDVSPLPFQSGQVSSGETEVRTSKVKWIPQNSNWYWLYERLSNYAIQANNELWNFDLHFIPEMIQYTEYHGNVKGHYDWHMDIGPGMLSRRKISITVQLSEPDEYEGGDLELFRGGEMEERNFIKANRESGLVFLFPSYMMHRVSPVTKGVRKSFVLWLGGTHYR